MGEIDCIKVRALAPEAQNLRKLLEYYEASRPKLYKALRNEAKRALSDMKLEEEEEDFYD